ncbi:glycoside hydrolase family 1 protein [Sphingomonas aracearum]|uniref:Glycoside hydrolase family 1 protein n=1 Tax=Sphingomonas aracearum TaxID=2283317 RepID=A0A369W240_9SPHN|nr:family 1 glycosylhydrolase [Sphingomonas aracearum]RDE07342.1 glycoside hydrolase family 1 protein [Sphingomonas aracearum]
MTDTDTQFSRRQIVAGAAAAATLAGAPSPALAAPRATPKGFLWGTAISAHQSEGNNTASDSWLLETNKPTAFVDPSGDACDSYHRYEEDLDIAASLGLNCYRFGIEWARIEPAEGMFSQAALDHYVRVLEACHARKLLPIVTYNHFTVPLWFAMRGGFEVADGADLFARFCARATDRLGPLIGMATTFNEANILDLRRILPRFASDAAAENARAMVAAARRRTSSPNFSSMLFGDPDKIDPVMLDGHAKATAAIKASAGNFPVGISLTMQEIQGVGPNNRAAWAEQTQYGGWLEAARKADFVGVQTYSRLRFDAKGLMKPEAGVPVTDMGYENYPSAIGATIRFAARHIGKPIYLTETGLGTNDDTQRVAFIKATMAEVGKCLDEGLDVRGYLYWSLLDNFEWTSGYAKKFGLVAVDRTTFKRTPKPSAAYLGMRARANRI